MVTMNGRMSKSITSEQAKEIMRIIYDPRRTDESIRLLVELGARRLEERDELGRIYGGLDDGHGKGEGR
jgi:hypothetical protein